MMVNLECYFSQLITTCIRRMTGGYIFSLSTLAGGGGGTPSQVSVGGYPISGLGRGTPSQVLVRGGTPPQVWVGGYPVPGLGGGYPISGLGRGGTLSQV